MLGILLQIYEHVTFPYTATSQPMTRQLYKNNSPTEHKSKINMSSDGDLPPFPNRYYSCTFVKLHSLFAPTFCSIPTSRKMKTCECSDGFDCFLLPFYSI